jgi:glucose PTS system EIICBA or EIICB component
LDYLKERVPSIITPIVFANLKQDEVVIINKQGNVELKEEGIISISK